MILDWFTANDEVFMPTRLALYVLKKLLSLD